MAVFAPKIPAFGRRWRLTFEGLMRNRSLHSSSELRLKALAKLGGKCSEPGCEWFNPDVLDVDHINPIAISGARDNTYHAYLTIVKMLHPEDEFQILCANHHRLKTKRDLEDVREFREQTRGLMPAMLEQGEVAR